MRIFQRASSLAGSALAGLGFLALHLLAVFLQFRDAVDADAKFDKMKCHGIQSTLLN
jgi:hypothetical protein